MRKQLFSLVLVVTLLQVAAQAQTEPAAQVDNDQSALQTLETGVTTNAFETSFDDVLKKLSDETGVKFWRHESAVGNSLDGEALITLQMGDLRLATALDLMLEPYHCTYVIVDGTIGVVSIDYALENPHVTAIDCSQLLAKIQPKKVIRRPRNNGGFGGGSAGGGGVFHIPDVPLQEQGSDEEMPPVQQSPSTETPESPPVPADGYYETVSPADQLIDLITNTVDPESWEVNGGTGVIQEINDVVVIRQTVRNLRGVNSLLESLDRAGIK